MLAEIKDSIFCTESMVNHVYMYKEYKNKTEKHHSLMKLAFKKCPVCAWEGY